MKSILSGCKAKVVGSLAGIGAVASVASNAFASGSSLTMPTLSTADIYTAGTAVLAFIAVPVGIFVVIGMLRRAGGR